MSTKHIFGGVVTKGQFVPDNPPAYAVRLSKLEGRRVRLSIVKPQLKATTSQHGYYRATVLPTIAEWAGYDHRAPRDLDAIHTGLKLRVFGAEERKGLQIIKSQAEYDVEEFSEFLDKVLRWTAEQGLYIPGPEEVA